MESEGAGNGQCLIGAYNVVLAHVGVSWAGTIPAI